MRTYRSQRGFTLVEILIVVIILGILAAVVIPQFTSASQDARKNSLASQLQTLRSQIELYKLQHLDRLPPGLSTAGDIAGATAWNEMIYKTDAEHNIGTDPTIHVFGPYVQQIPRNPLNGFTVVTVVAGATEPTWGDAVGTTDSSGFVFHQPSGKLFGTSKSGTNIYDETDPNALSNDN